MDEPLSPTIQKLRSLPKPSYHKRAWPEGTRQALTRPIAKRFFELLSTCDTSLMDLLREHPELPPFAQLNSWRACNKEGFDDQWREASKNRARFLAERCAELAKHACPKTAHVVRIKFDVYRWFAAKLYPEAYSERPLPPQQSTTVNVGIAISPERLTEIRSKLDSTRAAFALKEKTPNGATATGNKEITEGG